MYSSECSLLRLTSCGIQSDQLATSLWMVIVPLKATKIVVQAVVESCR